MTDQMFLVILFAVFAVCAFSLSMIGANIYSHTASVMNEDYEERIDYFLCNRKDKTVDRKGQHRDRQLSWTHSPDPYRKDQWEKIQYISLSGEGCVERINGKRRSGYNNDAGREDRGSKRFFCNRNKTAVSYKDSGK